MCLAPGIARRDFPSAGGMWGLATILLAVLENIHTARYVGLSDRQLAILQAPPPIL